MTKKNYDSQFCGSLPLNFINQVQPYGVLMVIQKGTFDIIQVSQNVDSITGMQAEDIVDTPFAQYITEIQFEKLSSKFSLNIQGKLPLTFTFTKDGVAKDYLAITHAKEDYLILELEELPQGGGQDSSFIGIYQELRYSMVAIESADNIEDVWNVTLKELKKVSGFDKIMIYQFDEDWNGIVVAETLVEGMPPYLGLRFPASDIPKQARAMYEKSPYRQIPDRDYVPSKLYPVINTVTQTFTDLSDCNLRGVAAVHIEYLKNMNVKASMSTRILKDGKLWGFISCHHLEPKFLGYERCTIFEMLSGIISTKLAALENQHDIKINSALQHIQSRLVEQIYKDNDIASGLLQHDVTIMDLLNVHGAAITDNKEVATAGATPDATEIKDLVIWLQYNKIDKIYCITDVADIYDRGIQFSDKGSGIIVLPVQPEKGVFVIGFRPEVEKEVNWGGNPDEAINFEKDTVRYHPRNSFKMWQQTVKHTSSPWHKQEIAVAEGFRHILTEFALKQL